MEQQPEFELKDVRANIFLLIDDLIFFILLQSDNNLLVSEMTKKLESKSSFQR